MINYYCKGAVWSRLC